MYNHKEAQHLKRMESDFQSLKQVVDLLKDPRVTGVVLSKYHLKADSPLLQAYLLDKDLDVTDGTLRRVDKEQARWSRIESLKEQYDKACKSIIGLEKEKERIEHELLKLTNKEVP